MIYGIVASEFHVTLPPGIAALGSFDFVNGIYDWNGTTLAASDVTDKTAWIGVDGLAVPASQSAGAQILYSATQTFLAPCSFTAVFEVQTSSTSDADIFWMANAGGVYSILLQWQNEWNLYDNDGNTLRWAEEWHNGLTVGIHKMAISRTDGSVIISVDGNTPASDTSASTLPVIGFPMTKFYLGGNDYQTLAAIKIRSASFYDLQLDSDLPTLSA